MVSEVSAWSLQKSSKLINPGMEHGNIWFEFDFKIWPQVWMIILPSTNIARGVAPYEIISI